MNRDEIVSYLKQLRDTIIARFEALEGGSSFHRKNWTHATGGGGEISLLRGLQFEKAAVNWSAVSGDRFPMNDGDGPFFATGISLITHMSNPHAPTVHMNIRYIETAKRSWLGGGYDLTPMGFPYQEDTDHFHRTAKQALDPISEEIYPQFTKNAKEYFYIPHWKCERGMGGLFFDHLSMDAMSQWKAVGESFLPAILPIYQRRLHQAFSPADRQKQLAARSRYVEFNLLYDRGTRFGFLSGGNPEAILCSMPPLVSW
jgi:coproporphyrinogen III oxidase